MQRARFTGIDSNFHSKFTFKSVSLMACFEIISVKSRIRTWNFNYDFLSSIWWFKYQVMVWYFCKYKVLISVKASMLLGIIQFHYNNSYNNFTIRAPFQNCNELTIKIFCICVFNFGGCLNLRPFLTLDPVAY